MFAYSEFFIWPSFAVIFIYRFCASLSPASVDCFDLLQHDRKTWVSAIMKNTGIHILRMKKHPCFPARIFKRTH